jgi:hypothetical protein
MNRILVNLPSGIGDTLQSLVGLSIVELFFIKSEIIVLTNETTISLISDRFKKIHVFGHK